MVWVFGAVGWSVAAVLALFLRVSIGCEDASKKSIERATELRNRILDEKREIENRLNDAINRTRSAEYDLESEKFYRSEIEQFLSEMAAMIASKAICCECGEKIGDNGVITGGLVYCNAECVNRATEIPF